MLLLGGLFPFHCWMLLSAPFWSLFTCFTPFLTVRRPCVEVYNGNNSPE